MNKEWEEEGYIKRRTEEGYTFEPFLIRKLRIEDVDEMKALETEIVAELEDSDAFAPDEKNEILDDLERGAMIFGVFVKGKLMAYRYISFPKRTEANYGRDIGMNGSELDNVVNFTTTIVHSEYRGNRLQRKTMKHALEQLKGTEYRYLIATISPLNYYSLKNMIRSGFVIKKIKLKYGKIADEIDGKIRYILIRDINDDIRKKYRKTIVVNNTEIDLQKNLIKNGYLGYDVDELDEFGEYKILFGIQKN
jgi:hypothetical protein